MSRAKLILLIGAGVVLYLATTAFNFYSMRARGKEYRQTMEQRAASMAALEDEWNEKSAALARHGVTHEVECEVKAISLVDWGMPGWREEVHIRVNIEVEDPVQGSIRADGGQSVRRESSPGVLDIDVVVMRAIYMPQKRFRRWLEDNHPDAAAKGYTYADAEAVVWLHRSESKEYLARYKKALEEEGLSLSDLYGFPLFAPGTRKPAWQDDGQ